MRIKKIIMMILMAFMLSLSVFANVNIPYYDDFENESASDWSVGVIWDTYQGLGYLDGSNETNNFGWIRANATQVADRIDHTIDIQLKWSGVDDYGHFIRGALTNAFECIEVAKGEYGAALGDIGVSVTTDAIYDSEEGWITTTREIDTNYALPSTWLRWVYVSNDSAGIVNITAYDESNISQLNVYIDDMWCNYTNRFNVVTANSGEIWLDNFSWTSPQFPGCTANWTCEGYDACVSPATSVACNNATDQNSCGGAYLGDYTEFTNLTCSYASQTTSTSSSTSAAGRGDVKYCIDDKCYATAEEALGKKSSKSSNPLSNMWNAIMNWFKNLKWNG